MRAHSDVERGVDVSLQQALSRHGVVHFFFDRGNL
jgi:hypothetical protein